VIVICDSCSSGSGGGNSSPVGQRKTRHQEGKRACQKFTSEIRGINKKIETQDQRKRARGPGKEKGIAKWDKVKEK
jgi:hypothetical protein